MYVLVAPLVCNIGGRSGVNPVYAHQASYPGAGPGAGDEGTPLISPASPASGSYGSHSHSLFDDDLYWDEWRREEEREGKEGHYNTVLPSFNEFTTEKRRKRGFQLPCKDYNVSLYNAFNLTCMQ